MRILVSIPVYNERQYVARVLDKVRRFHSNILVIDDGSTDGTAQYLATRTDIQLIQHPSNLGYGQSIIDAFHYAQTHGYDWVITLDCDEQHEPEMIPQFIRHILMDRWDILSGSRYLHPHLAGDLPPSDRRSINVTITCILNDLFNLNLTDAFCGFKAHRVSAMCRLQLDVPGYAFPMQLWPQSVAANLRIKELPVRLIYNDPTRHFGGDLDDASNRLHHYLQILTDQIRRLQSPLPNNQSSLPACCAQP